MPPMDEDVHEDGFDLESYISSYAGHTKVDRLMFIAGKSAGKPLELEALKLAHDELKKGENTVRYGEVCSRIDGRLGPAYQFDSKYAEQVDRRAAQKQERLESELHGYKAALRKESIRMGQNDLGDYFYERGDLQNAFKAYVKTRDYCTTPKHIVAMCLNIIKTAVELANYMHVANYAAKAEQTPDVLSDLQVASKLKAATALAHLHGKKYKQAAKAFLEVGAELGASYNDVLAPQDVALYGSLCALASLDRSELRTRLITNLAFKEFLELVPEVRELVHDFYNSRYTSCLRALEALRPQLALDLHLGEGGHSAALYRSIRSRALVQYTAPFTTVDLRVMAEAFNTGVAELEKELAALVMDGQIHARIDSHSKVLVARRADVRAATFQRVLATGEDYLRQTKALLLRANLLQHDLMQKPRKGAMPADRDPRAGVYDRMGYGESAFSANLGRTLRELL